MSWVAIVAALLQVFGPLLVDWLKECTEEKLTDAASALPPAESFVTEGAAVAALFDKAIARLHRFAFVRRAALRRMKAAAIEGDKLRRTPLTADEIAEGRDLVGGVRSEI